MRTYAWIIGFFGGLGLLLYAAGTALLPEVPLALNIVGGVGAAMVAAWLLSDWSSVRGVTDSQTFGRRWIAGIAVMLAAGITVTLNIIAHRYDTRWDMTANKQYTLSQQSVDIAKALDRKIEVKGFFIPGTPDASNVKDLLSRYTEHSSLIEVSWIDPFSQPTVAQENKVSAETGALILKAGDKEQRIESKFDEESVTNALIRLTSDVVHTVCFVQGHGEPEMDDSSSQLGLGFVKKKLEDQNYEVSALSLVGTQPTPETCKVVILAAPEAALLPAELDRLAVYVAGGGALIGLMDPRTPGAVAADMARYGIAVGNDVVVEMDPYRVFNSSPFMPLLPEDAYEAHPLTNKLSGASVLLEARSAGITPVISGINTTVLARTSDSSWAETDYNASPDSFAADAGKDIVGKVPVIAVAEISDPSAVRTVTPVEPITLGEGALPAPTLPAATVTVAPKAGGKVVVYGDVDFASNLLVGNGINQDLLLNTVAWMAGEESQISVRANEAGKGRLTVDLIALFVAGTTSILVVPGITALLAVAAWLRRRKL